MQKNGFTLIEVIVSVVLVSVVLTVMLASLVKLKTSYELVSENTDALVFSSAITRVINNDFDANGGIRYIDCTYYGDVCDITLNNNEKRKIQIKSVQSGLTWKEHYDLFDPENNKSLKEKQDFFEKIVIKITKKDKVFNGGNSNTAYISLAEFYGAKESDNFKKLSAQDKKTIKELVFEGNTSVSPNVVAAFENQYCDKIDEGLKSYLSGMCTLTENLGGGYDISCDCTKQELSTSLVYSDVTNGVNEHIYVKTLSLIKTKDLYTKDNAGSLIGSTNKIRTNGYNFGKLSYTNLTYPNTSIGGDYEDSISLISIDINDGISVMDTSYNVNLSSSSSYSASSTQIGKLICFDFDNFGIDSYRVSSVSHLVDEFCIRYGVSFNLKKDSYFTKVNNIIVSNSHTNPTNCDSIVNDANNLKNVCHSPFIKETGKNYKFGGYFYDRDNNLSTIDDRIEVIDKDGNIKITTTYFDVSANGSKLYIKWLP